MPDEYGNLKGISVPAAAWERIFGSKLSPEAEENIADVIQAVNEELTRRMIDKLCYGDTRSARENQTP